MSKPASRTARLCAGLAGLIARTRAATQAFRTDRSGNVTLIFAFAIIPLFGAVGAAVDFSQAAFARTQLLAVADAASLGAIAKASTGFNTALTMSSDASIPSAEQDALKIFKAELKGRKGFTLGSATATVTKTGRTLSARINFSGNVTTSFMGMFGVKSIPISGTSKADLDVPIFIDFYLFLDNSPSMGVAATPKDVATMINNTPDQCAFACHDLSGAQDYYTLAKKLGVTMRIDVLRSATQQLMDTAAKTALVPSQFRVAIYTFNTDLQTITPLTSSLSTAKSQAANIDLMPVPYQGYNNDQATDFGVTMPLLDKQISTPGPGTSSATPQKVVLLVSDGVGDANVGGTRTIGPISASLCSALKNRGIKIAVLYTTYLPLPTNAFYKQNVGPWINTINPAMQSCASPGLFFEVSPTQGVADAMTALFQKTVSQAHLTR